ncbi:MAG: FAD-dependent oxidoreductase, partial [Candidatus Lambdaproteobacteria bacterium]|nr:FAD-dependent oxidoreductase [Candidatus Lambdaproteobacteria bacterium]
MAESYSHLFSPIRLGAKQVPNRVMRLATTTNLGENHQVSERLLGHYRAIAQGGAGSIVTESTRIHPAERAREGALYLFQREVIPGLRRLADTVHGEGALLFVQLNHGGRQHHSALIPNLVAPSAIACPHSGGVPHELTLAEVEDMIASFIRAALHAREGGCDGVEIHGAQGHLIQEFLSPFSNRRTDEYGGSFENRLRFARRIIQGVREKTGRDFVVGYRLGVEEFTPGGITLEDSKRVAREFAAEGLIDYLSLSQGNFNTIETHLPDRHSPPLVYQELHAAVKAEAGALPVVASTRIKTPAQAESLLAGGKADLIGLCRALIADPDWPRKSKSGRADEIRLCIACNQCWGWSLDSRPLSCVVNPLAGREHELGPLAKAEQSRRVVVVGGGPAGLEAARVAAERGHRVVVLERGDKLGGKLQNVDRLPLAAEVSHAVKHLAAQVARLGVDVRMATTASAELVAAERPDAVVVATGATPYVPELPSDGSVPLLTGAGLAYAQKLEGARIVVMDEDGYYWAEAVLEAALRHN